MKSAVVPSATHNGETDPLVEAWFFGFMDQAARSSDHIATATVELTPALAKVLMAMNRENRRVSQTKVENYARDMLAGKWLLNGEPIIIASDGLMNDGQHRCLAVIESGVSIRTIIVAGTDRATRFTIDQGLMRTSANYLDMEGGHESTTALAAMASLVLQRRNFGKISKTGVQRPNRSEILDTVRVNVRMADSLGFVQTRGSGLLGGRSLLAFCHFVFANVGGEEEAGKFISSLINGEGLSAGDPILYVRNRIIADRARLSINDKAELIFRAWNAWRRGERPRAIPVMGDALPTVV